MRTRLLPSVNLNESIVVLRRDVDDLDVFRGRVDDVEAFAIARQRQAARNAALDLDGAGDLLGRFVDDPDQVRDSRRCTACRSPPVGCWARLLRRRRPASRDDGQRTTTRRLIASFIARPLSTPSPCRAEPSRAGARARAAASPQGQRLPACTRRRPRRRRRCCDCPNVWGSGRRRSA